MYYELTYSLLLIFFMLSSFVLKPFFSSTKNFFLVFLLSLFIFLSSMSLISIHDMSYNSSSIMFVDQISLPIIMMTILLMIALEISFMHSLYTNLLFLFSFFTFSCSKIIAFYVAFELNLVPIFLIILGWGYQPERIFANKMMMLYTLVGSLPLLLLVIASPQFTQFSLFFLNQSLLPSFMVFFMTTLAFLVKLPIFSLHLWLPLAHVEAPLMGSMILAGILLKLGGYGLMRFLYLSPAITSSFIKFMVMFTTVGGALAMTFCVTQVDMKIIIAYSSVGHMSIASASIFSLSTLGVSSAMINFVAHGFTSSLMFFMAGVMYSFSGTRHIILNKGIITIAPLIVAVWFFVCLLNAGGPPTMNLLAEITATMAVINLTWILTPSIVMALFLGMLFNMKLFSITAQGNFSETLTLSAPSSFATISSGLFHLATSLLLVLAISMMIFYSNLMFLLA